MEAEKKQAQTGGPDPQPGAVNDVTRQIEQVEARLGNRIEKLEEAERRRSLERMTKVDRAHKASLRAAGISGGFLVLVGLSVLVRTWLFAAGCISLEQGKLSWLLGHDVLLAVVAAALLVISLAIASRLSRDD